MLTRLDSTDYPPCSNLSMTPAARRAILLRNIAVVIDAGANEGQYAEWMRSTLGFGGRIISFEPSARTFETLERQARGDDRWECHRLALGETDQSVELQTAALSQLTSLYQPTAEFLNIWPEAAKAETETVEMRTLSTLWPTLNPGGPVYLKIDVEGAELAVLEGAATILDQVAVIELELSLVPAYVGAPVLLDVVRFLAERGFSILALEQNLGDDETTGQQFMADALFRAAG
jgi:FkbM family methyltransferase